LYLLRVFATALPLRGIVASSRLILVFTLICFSALSAENIKFERQKIIVAHKTIEVELADTPEKLARGLMDRTNLAANEGMLFVFSDEQVRTFWMKNTYIPLAIGFFDKEKNLVDSQEMAPIKSSVEIPKTYQSKKPAKYVLEMNKGWFSKNKIPLKSKFSFVKKSSL